MARCSFQNDGFLPDTLTFDSTKHPDNQFPSLMSFGMQRVVFYNPSVSRNNFCIHREKVADCVWKVFLGRHNITTYDERVKFFVQNRWEENVSKEICKGRYPSVILPRIAPITAHKLTDTLVMNVSQWPIEQIRGTGLLMRRNHRYHECIVCLNDKAATMSKVPERVVVVNSSNVPLVVVADDDSCVIIPHSTLVFRSSEHGWTVNVFQE